jgi:hypothetical protein
MTRAILTPCPVCLLLIGHDRKLHQEAEQQAKEQGRKK